MKVLYVGTAEFGLPSLEALLNSSGHQIVGVITQPDRPAGRGMEDNISPVKEKAVEHELPIYQPEDINSEKSMEWIEMLAPDAFLVAAYGQIISQGVLDLVRFPVNIHGSLLPDYRGAAPVNWAIINGEEETGVTSMLMNSGMDTGPMLLQRKVSVGPDQTAGELHDELARIGGELLSPTLDGLELATLSPIPQPKEGKEAPKLCREDGELDWRNPSETIHNKVRGMNPWPGAYTFFEGTKVKVHRTKLNPSVSVTKPAGEPGGVRGFTEEGILLEAGDGEMLEIRRLQPESKQKMDGREFANGYRIEKGDRFGD